MSFVALSALGKHTYYVFPSPSPSQKKGGDLRITTLPPIIDHIWVGSDVGWRGYVVPLDEYGQQIGVY